VYKLSVIHSVTFVTTLLIIPSKRVQWTCSHQSSSVWSTQEFHPTLLTPSHLLVCPIQSIAMDRVYKKVSYRRETACQLRMST